MGGHAEVNSEPQKGTSFKVTIPLLQAETLSPAATLPALQVIHLEEEAVVPQHQSLLPESVPLVLVVEDHDGQRNFIASGLAAKYREITAINGAEGWQTAQDELPDLVISDVAMPEMDGFTLTQLIKDTPLTTHIAVILLTAKASSQNRLHGLNTNDYLTKPFNLQELHLRIANLLSHQQKLREYWHNQFIVPASKDVMPVEQPAIEDPFLLAVNPVLEQELANADFTVEQLARQMTVSTRTLHRKLSSLTGMNATELIRSYRLSKAAVYLKEGQSVSDVAWKVGFENLSYFSKCFKEQYSVTPSGYGSQN